MDDDSDIMVRGTEGSEGNVLWFHVRGKSYAFRYEHADGTVEIRRDSVRGQPVAKMDNSTTVDELREVFEGLAIK